MGAGQRNGYDDESKNKKHIKQKGRDNNSDVNNHGACHDGNGYTTFQMPTISMASEMESSVAIESQIEEGTSEESVSVQSETIVYRPVQNRPIQ